VFSLLCFKWVWFYLFVAGLVLPVVFAGVFDFGLALVPVVDLGVEFTGVCFSEDSGLVIVFPFDEPGALASGLTAFGMTKLWGANEI
jgi:hypothetical protein